MYCVCVSMMWTWRASSPPPPPAAISENERERIKQGADMSICARALAHTSLISPTEFVLFIYSCSRWPAVRKMPIIIMIILCCVCVSESEYISLMICVQWRKSWLIESEWIISFHLPKSDDHRWRRVGTRPKDENTKTYTCSLQLDTFLLPAKRFWRI